ncbi:survival motor neuron interacting protein 1-domain-containing protein [Dimargaris cristalligena]|uniref:Survival motor neuron interacting protein 1-domain-containing protein n=1 Tax=Dimargaris cristalligena TaxID=215637 RepID=A0A4Q0A0G5_9FUNG|nr:survival motor neuron interacting protein 1-domain-containing protein [Dimargaris cristalligena]|eukprot:RKP39576.1 survival motor neuron interacting protein 1-domain-containing protein [Dimargaris cristalligena]
MDLPALPVDEEPVVRPDRMDVDPFSHPPTSANKYLRMVRQQARQLPSIAVAQQSPAQPSTRNITPSSTSDNSIFSTSSCAPPPPGLEPREQWQIQLARDFRGRQKKFWRLFNSHKTKDPCRDESMDISAYPASSDKDGWLGYCYGIPTSRPPAANETEAIDSPQGHPPTHALLFRLEQYEVVRLIQHHTNWLKQSRIRLEKEPTAELGVLACCFEPLNPLKSANKHTLYG